MDVVSLCQDLIRIKSENPPGDTEEIVEYIRDFTTGIGIKTIITRKKGGRWNLVSAGAHNPLLLCGHVDVVPALADGWSVDPYSGVIREGQVWGRGATDMKGGCASILWACKTLADDGIVLPCDIAFVCDEETSGTYGIRHLLEENLLRPCDCLIAEPTPPLNPNIGQKGLLRINFNFKGQPGHSSLYPAKGVSAIMEACTLLQNLSDIHNRDYDPGGELSPIIDESFRILEKEVGLSEGGNVLKRVMFNPGKITGGEKANIVAQRCALELDIRIPWGCSIPCLIEELSSHAPGSDTEIVNSAEPSYTSPKDRVVKRLEMEISRVYDAPASPIVSWAASDARYLRKAGFSVIEYGPGDVSLLHAIDERVPLESLHGTTEIYRGFIRAYCPE
ncbi:MAG TPA: ArgE/DapE family deacylase [Methanoregulaceae archaeon]|nr:ArgE/DapE family deacylase [Methanoregulaceae archaeon]